MPLSEVFKALADPTRRQILDRLKHGPLSAGEIAEGFAMSKPSVSHHLALLKGAGLIESEKNGQFVIYALNLSVFEEVAAMMFDLFSVEPAKHPAPDVKGAAHEA
ncbi:winged helix-turn-helix transcriptional regulator [bacterium]|nr:winged helix-turn-helix transcriptional regulator [bacterium]